MQILIERLVSPAQPGWLSLRQALWPEGDAEEHLAEMADFLAQPDRYAQFIALSAERNPIGFAETSIRTDYVNGTMSSPVAFLEGIYVSPQHRRQGVASALISAVVNWAHDTGCSELASDALLRNESSHAAHRALGFEETERVVYFRKRLP